VREQLNRRTLILLGLTVLVALFFVFDFMFGGKKPRRSPAEEDPATAARLAEAKAKLAATQGATPAPAGVPAPGAAPRLTPPPPPDQPWGRDPFAVAAKYIPQAAKGPDRFAGFKIWGVLCGPQGCQAVVNDLVVRTGDRVDGARVVRVTKDGVELERDGETRFLTVIDTGMFR